MIIKMLLIKNIKKLITLNGKNWHHLGIFKNLSILINKHGYIHWIGYKKPNNIKITKIFNAHNNVIIPGLIDCHTHLIFSGDRSYEFYLRTKGITYLNIMNKGSGILNTVNHVRKTSIQKLIKLTLPYLKEMLSFGITTIEAKSGYGLTLKDELKLLNVIQILNNKQSIEIEPTFLGAHSIPIEYKNNKNLYIKYINNIMIPIIAKKKLAKFCDIFIEKHAFNKNDAITIINQAKKFGLIGKAHTEQFTHSNGAYAMSNIDILSLSHIEHINHKDIKHITDNNIITEILPIAQQYLQINTNPPIKQLIKNKVKICIGTDFNPGSSMSHNIQYAARLAVASYKLSCEQALLGITKNPALAVNRNNIGQINIGKQGDLCILNTQNIWSFFSNWTKNTVKTVFKKGEIVYHRNKKK